MTNLTFTESSPLKSVLIEFWYYFSRNRGAVIGLFVFLLLILIAIFAPIIAPHEPNFQFRENFLTPTVMARRRFS